MEIEVTQSGVEAERRLPRRGILAAGIGGAALSLLPFLSGRAAASATTDSTPAESTTTTAPPLRPTADDITMLAFAQQMELTAAGLYEQAIAGVAGWSETEASVMAYLREAHLAFGNTLSGLLGKSAPGNRSEELFAQWKSKFGGSTADALASASDLESAFVATYLDMLASLQGVNGATVVASIVIAEARQTTVLRDLAGAQELADLLVDVELDTLLGNG